MIILFEVNETAFATLGLGVLTDAFSCSVGEKLNDQFTVQMEYPITGKHFSKIQNNRILYCKPNPYDHMQAFRIYSIEKPINGMITVNAVHVSYDMNNIPVNAFSATSLQDLLVKIQNGSVIAHSFKFNSDLTSAKTYKMTSPANLRAIIMGGEKSIVTEYDAELKFNNFNVEILQKRGRSNGAVVRYGNNMLDMNHESSTELLYNGVFPFYHKETEKNETSVSDEFTQVYIVGSKPLQDGWLSFSKDGQPYHPVDTSPIQIATEGDFYQKVYVWNDVYQIYQEKQYNQTVTVLQGILEPEWISIDWSGFPNIACKAAKKGYFKVATSDSWGDIKGVGDVVFEGSITSSGIMENMILYYSEVIPSNTESTNTDVTEVVDVQLATPILMLETPDAKAMKYSKILMLDLTSEFEEQPTQERLQAKAEEYINKNKVGTIKHSTTVSFVDLSTTTEKSKYENFDHIEIGDTVKIIYEDAGVSVELRVISTEYDALLDRYTSIELGEKKDTMSSESVQNGDGVSALTNDAGYATVTTVNKLIADVITANYIEALNAKLTKAQISQLEVERINVKGIIEASQFTIDSLVAKLLVADNADIANVLTAGSIKVAGDITINSGEISITSDAGVKFIVDREGNLTANSVFITGGTLNMNDGVFEVTNDGVLTAKDALIIGHIEATSGQIGGFSISEKELYTGNLGSGIYLSGNSSGSESPVSIAGSGSISGWVFAAGNNFGVTKDGKLFANNATISGNINVTNGSINIGYITGTDPAEYNFKVDSYGNTYIKSNLNVGYNIQTETYAFTVDDDGVVSASDLTITGGEIKIDSIPEYTAITLTSETYFKYRYYYKTGDEYFLSKGEYDSGTQYYVLNSGTYFSVDNAGNLTTNSLTITGGYLDINSGAFSVSETGLMIAKEAYISGTVHIDYGEIMLGVDNWQYEEIDPILAIETYRANIFYYEDRSGHYILDTNFSITSGRTYYRFVPIDPNDGTYNANFYISNDGDMYAASAHISGEVNVTSGSITIGNNAFVVDNTGNVTIANGGSIKLGGESGTYLDAEGNIKVGYNSVTEEYSFKLDKDGALSIGGMFSVDKDGNFNLFQGAISQQTGNNLRIGRSDIDSIASCTSATITNLVSSSIVNSGSFITTNEYVNGYIYFDQTQLVRLGSASSAVSYTQTVVFTPSTTLPMTLTESGNIYVKLTPNVTTKGPISVEVTVTYYIHYQFDPTPKFATKKINFYVPTGTTNAIGVTESLYFQLSFEIFSFEISNVQITYGASSRDITYYENASSNLELQGAFIPSSYSNTSYTLGLNNMPWNKLYLFDRLRISKSSSYLASDYLDNSFNGLMKHEPSLATNYVTGPILKIGVSSKTPNVDSILSYSDYSLLGLYSSGSIEIKASGGNSNSNGVGSVIILSNEAHIDINANRYIELSMFGNTIDLNRQGLFIDFTSWTSSDSSALYNRAGASSYWSSNKDNDHRGPWELQVYWLSGIGANSTFSITLPSPPNRQAYAAMFQEYAESNGILNRATCRIEDYSVYYKNKITVYNNRATTLDGWLWVLYLRIH